MLKGGLETVDGSRGRPITSLFMVQFLLRRCGSRPGQVENNRHAKIMRMKHQIGLAGISFNPHHFIFKKEGRF